MILKFYIVHYSYIFKYIKKVVVVLNRNKLSGTRDTVHYHGTVPTAPSPVRLTLHHILSRYRNTRAHTVLTNEREALHIK